MATADKGNFPNMDSINTTNFSNNRPISVYDNLHAAATSNATLNNNQKICSSALSSSIKPQQFAQPVKGNICTDDKQQKQQQYHNLLRSNAQKCKQNNDSCRNNDNNEFPFSDISFKFDDLPSSPDKEIRETIGKTLLLNNMKNYLHHQPHHSSGNSYKNDENHHNVNSKSKPVVSNQGYNFIGNNNNNNINNNTGKTTANDNVKTVVKKPSPYENVSETVKLRNLNKPVISDAKSSFFGLSANNYSDTMKFQQNGTTSNGDRAPLITNSLLQLPPPTKSVEYQNIPTNSALFQQQNLNNCDQSDSVILESHDDLDNQFEHLSNPSSSSNRRSSSLESNQHHNNYLNNNNYADGTQMSAATSGGVHGNSGDDSRYYMDDRMLPSQAVYMSTTVPQNIKGNDIMGRHTPTRNSLRHSRMIVVNKNYQATTTDQRPNPMEIRYPCLAKQLLIFQIILGFCITSIGVWILLWAPNTRTRDNPYWSGIILILSGIFGLILIEFKRIPRQKIREHCFTFIRLNSIIITIFAIVCTFLAFVFAAIHLSNITSEFTTCMPANMFSANAACICLFGGANGNATSNLEIKTAGEGEISIGGFEFTYKDLNCGEVKCEWKYILIASTILNVLCFIISLMYLLLLCFRQKTKRKSSYAPVRSRL